jgi:hypothetical protein
MADWTCAASDSLPLDKESAWDGAAAQDSVFSAYGWPDNPKPDQAKRAFLCYDSSAADLKGSYSLPFAAVKEGKLTALASGLRAAASRLPQKDGLPDDVRAQARAVLDTYFDKINPDPGSEPDADDKGRTAPFAFPMRVVRARDTAALLTKVRAAAADPSIFDETPPFFWSSEASSSRMDAYMTHMLPSTLRNFAADMQAGVNFQNSHKTDELGFGHSLDGRFVGGGGNGVARAEGDFYTLPGLNLNGVPTDDLIRGIRSGLINDNSVGFYLGTDGRYICDICNRDLNECNHFPGIRYPVEGRKEPVMATAGIDGAHMGELSAVYDGATPGAGVLKAQRASEAGLLEPQTARLLEAQYRIALPASHRAWSGADLKGSNSVSSLSLENARQLALDTLEECERARYADGFIPDKETTMPEMTLDDVRRDLRRLLEMQDPSIDPVAHVLEMAPQIREVTTLRAERDQLLPLADEVKRLTPLADMGRQYHVDLLEATLAEGVRAQGNGFPLETQRALLANATLDQLKTLKAAYEQQAQAALAGGRVSADKGEPDPNAAPVVGKNDWTPKGAYAG